MVTSQGHLAAWRRGGGAGNRKGRREASKEDTRVLSKAAGWAAEAGVTGMSSVQPEGSRELRGQEASGDTRGEGRLRGGDAPSSSWTALQPRPPRKRHFRVPRSCVTLVAAPVIRRPRRLYLPRRPSSQAPPLRLPPPHCRPPDCEGRRALRPPYLPARSVKAHVRTLTGPHSRPCCCPGFICYDCSTPTHVTSVTRPFLLRRHARLLPQGLCTCQGL